MNKIEIEIVYPGEKKIVFDRQPVVLREFPEVLDYPIILEETFAQWNRGSGQESKKFLRQKNCRSLSVGDFVRVQDKWFHCDMIGWNEVSAEFVENFQHKIEEFLRQHPDHIPFSATQAVFRESR
jgi:hypothetical protein